MRHRFVGIKRSIKTNEKTGNNEWWIRRRFQIHCVVNWTMATAATRSSANKCGRHRVRNHVRLYVNQITLTVQNEWNLFMGSNGRPQMKYQLESHKYRRAHRNSNIKTTGKSCGSNSTWMPHLTTEMQSVTNPLHALFVKTYKHVI